MAIKINHLSYRYHHETKLALDDVSLVINEGEKVAIIGNNGSGKSTLAKVLIGLVKPQQGTVLIDDVPLTEQNLLAIRAKIGVVFQNPNFQFIGSNVEEDIAFGLQNQNIDREEMKKIIATIAADLEFQSLLKLPPHLLSGGQKQKVALASILVLKPKYLILDEVTSMLDSQNTKEVWSTLEKVHQKALTIISITHDMDLAALADRIIVMSAGKIIGDGSPQAILNTHFTDEAFATPSFEMELSTKLFKDKWATSSLETLVHQLEQRWKSK